MFLKKINKASLLLSKNLVLSVCKNTLKDYTKSQGKKDVSSLTYYSVLSIVPMLAISFAIAKGFQLSVLLKNKVLEIEIFQNYQDEVRRVFGFVENMLDDTSSGLISGISIAVLLYTSVSLLNNVTNSFNAVWGVLQPKAVVKRISNFLGMFFMVPIVAILSIGITSFLNINSSLILQHLSTLPFLKYIILYGLKLIPFIMMMMFISLVFIIIPETNVSIRAAFMSAFVTTLLFYVTQKIFITFQIGVSKYNAIYGSFAALPLFFLLVHTSWMIVIVGTYLCKHIHYLHNTKENEQLQETNMFLLKKYCLIVFTEIVQRFQRGESPISKVELYQGIDAPNAVINRALEVLKSTKLISIVALQKHHAYQPYKDINTIKISDFITQLEHEPMGMENLQKQLDDNYPEEDAYIRKVISHIKASGDDVLIKDIKL